MQELRYRSDSIKHVYYDPWEAGRRLNCLHW